MTIQISNGVKTKIALLSIFIGFFAVSFVFAQEDTIEVDVTTEATEEAVEIVEIPEVVEDETITADDLEVSDPTLLPDSSFYFLKNWQRGVQSFFTFNGAKKAELKLRFANEKLLEVEKLVEKSSDEFIVEEAIANYEEELEETEVLAQTLEDGTDANTDKFLDKFADFQIKRQKLIDKLVKKLPEQAQEQVAEVHEKSLERFADVISRLDTPERLQERFDAIEEKQEGSKYKHFKNLEVLIRIEEKLPDQAKEAMHKAQENALKRLHDDLSQMSPEDQERFKDYVSNIGGHELRHAEVIDRLEREDLSEDLREKIQTSRHSVINRVERKLDEITDEEKKEKYLKHLEDGDLGKLRILNELKERLPEKHHKEIDITRDRAINIFGDRVEDLNEEKRKALFNRIEKNNDARTFGVLNDLEEKLSPDKVQFVKELRGRGIERLQEEYNGAKDEEAKKRIIERLSGDDPRHIQVLRELQAKVSPNARDAIGRAINTTETNRMEKIKRLEELKIVCPRIAPPSPEFKEKCELRALGVLGKVVSKKDRNGCITGYECIPDPEVIKPTLCTEEFSPVCSVNGKTFSNKCKARVAGIEIKHDGQCQTTSDKPIPTTINIKSVEPKLIGDPELAFRRWQVKIIDGKYSPRELTIKKGDTVVWTNKSDRRIWPASASHPTHRVYPAKGGCIGSAFDACKGLNNGDSFRFTFNEAGTWKYHDHLHSSVTGAIVVQ